MSTANPTPITYAALQQALASVQRPGWPSSVEACLARRPYRIALHAIARNLAACHSKTPPQLPCTLPLFDQGAD